MTISSQSDNDDLIIDDVRDDQRTVKSLTDDYEEAAQDDSSSLDETLIPPLLEALRDDQGDVAKDIVADLKPADQADIIGIISEEDRQQFLDICIDAIDPEAFTSLDDDFRKTILETLDPMAIANIISDLESDDAVDLIYNLEPTLQKAVIRKLSAKNRAAIEEGLNFPEDSAGRLMQREFVAIPQFWTVGKTIDYMRAAEEELPEDFYTIIVIDPMYHVVGEIELSRIMRSKRSVKIEDLANEDVTKIQAEMDQEDVARIFRREHLISAPVIDTDNRVIGIITVDDIVDVIEEEAQEDILRLGGVEGSDIYRAVLSTTKSRFSWLFINLLTAIAASIVIGLFDATIEQVVALAVLMPIVASMGGNAGTQTLTVAVRALATKQISSTNMWRMVSKETVVGLLNGIAFAIISGLLAWGWFKDPLLGGVIATAMVINMVVAGLSGILIPITLDRLKIDPALASSVFLTTITDVIGFFAFLGLAAVVMF